MNLLWRAIVIILLGHTFFFVQADHHNSLIKPVGSYYGEWHIPNDLMYKKGTCYCFGLSSGLSFEVGMLALSDYTVHIIADKVLKSRFDKTQKDIKDENAIYVDYEQIYPLAPNKSNQLLFSEKNSFNNTVITKNDLVKVVIKDQESYDILYQLLSKGMPCVLCIQNTQEDNKKMANLINFIIHKGYSLIKNNKDRDFTLIKGINYKLKNLDRRKPDSFCISTLYTELYETNPVHTEHTVYKILQRNPLNMDINYCAIPWFLILKNSYTQPLKKPIPKNIAYDGGFTVCQGVLYIYVLPILKKLGIDTLFTPHVDKKYYGLRVFPFPHYPVNGVDPAQKKDICYSFIGMDNHKIRNTIFKMKHPDNAVIIKRKFWHFARDTYIPNCNTEQQQKREKQEYQDVLARSRFSLCPRGIGKGTIRFWESLQAGAIPIVIGDGTQLPEIIDWSKCAIFIPENQVYTILDRLKDISFEQEKLMRANCLKAFELLCAGDNFVNTIKYYLISGL